MNILRVGCVEYVNALPFHLPFSLKKIVSDVEFVFAVPTQLNELLRKKELDIALTSSVEYLDGDYALLAGFGIAGKINGISAQNSEAIFRARARVRARARSQTCDPLPKILSVNLYCQLPIHKLSGKTLGVTPHSSTSIALLKVLCHHLWKIEPKFEVLNREKPYSTYAAILLIGNEALENLTIPGFQTIDLAAAWYAMTALPFVFALFAVRKESEIERLAGFQKQLEAALEWSHSHRERVEREAMKQCSLPHKLIRHYYSLLNYRLGEQEREGLNTFKELRRDVSAICT